MSHYYKSFGEAIKACVRMIRMGKKTIFFWPVQSSSPQVKRIGGKLAEMNLTFPRTMESCSFCLLFPLNSIQECSVHLQSRIYNIDQSGRAFAFVSQSQAKLVGEVQDDILDDSRFFWKDRGLPPPLYLKRDEIQYGQSKSRKPTENN